MGGLKAYNQSFSAVGELSDMFDQTSMDGSVYSLPDKWIMPILL